MKKQLSVEGMTCGHCAARVKSALTGIHGVTQAEVDQGRKLAVVEGTALDDAHLHAAIAEAGYRVVAIS